MPQNVFLVHAPYIFHEALHASCLRFSIVARLKTVIVHTASTYTIRQQILNNPILRALLYTTAKLSCYVALDWPHVILTPSSHVPLRLQMYSSSAPLTDRKLGATCMEACLCGLPGSKVVSFIRIASTAA